MINLQPSVATQTMPRTADFYCASAVSYGQLVYVSGYNAASGKFAVTLADADVAGRTPQFVAMENIAAAGTGTFAAMDQALVGIVDTSGGAIGDAVYLSATAGGMTLTAPTGAARVTVVGYVKTVSATTGTVQLLPADNIIDKELSSIDFQGPQTITSASASALAVGLNGATNPSFVVDSSTASQAAGLKVTGAIAAGTVAAAVISSGGAANLTLDAKGTGTIGIGTVSTGAITLGAATGITGTLTITSANAAAFAVGRLGATTPAFSVDAATGTQTAGFKVTGAALNGTVALVVTDTSGSTNLTINALGSGTIGIGSVSTGAVTITPASNHTGLASFAASAAVTGQVLHGAAADGSTPGTSTAAFKQGTPPVGAATTTSKIYADATVMRKINAAGTDTAIG